MVSGVILLASGCLTLNDLDWGEIIGENDTPITEPDSPETPTDDGELVGGNARIMSIATDSKNQPHIIADVGGTSVNYFYDKIGNKWSEITFNSGGESPQAYNPHIEINEDDQAWYSVVKWYSHGMGMMLRENMAKSPTQVLMYSRTTGGMGNGKLPCSNLSIDVKSKNKCIVYGGNGGLWERYNWTGSNFQSLSTGTIDVGQGGEKNYFHISRAKYVKQGGDTYAIWHGCSDWSYNNSLRKANYRGEINWINRDKYGSWAGYDECYPIVVGDNIEPQTAYLATDYTQFGGPGLMMNIWKGNNNEGDGNFVFPIHDLLNIDSRGTSGMGRYEPQLYPAKSGGVWICYNNGSNIHIKYIPSTITSANQIVPLTNFVGTRGTICCDKKGDIHVAYLHNGVKYRKIKTDK